MKLNMDVPTKTVSELVRLDNEFWTSPRWQRKKFTIQKCITISWRYRFEFNGNTGRNKDAKTYIIKPDEHKWIFFYSL